jgi:hypothetical protein
MNELTRHQDIMINRPASAPPSLEFSNTPFQNNAFLFETGVVDIRESPQYEKFYHNNLSKHMLPPPFQSDFLPGGNPNSSERANVSEHFDQLLPTINIQSAQPALSYLKSPRLDGLRDEKFIKVSPKVTPRGMSTVQKTTSPGVTPRKIESPQQQQSPITSSPRREGSPSNTSSTSPIGSPVRTGSPTSSVAKAENPFLSLQPGGKLESLALSPRGLGQLSGSPIGGNKSILSDKIFPTEFEITKELATLSLVDSLSSPLSGHPVETTPQGFQICKYFLNGFCARGDTCNFMHEPNFPSPYVNKNALNSQMPNGKKMSTRNTNKAGRFSASHYENVEIKDCIGQICFICKDQQGCRFLQREIDKSGSQVVDIIFAEVIAHVNELIDDPFGNYLVQKLIDVVSPEQRFRILAEVRHDLVNISKNIHGTRASQKLIELLDSSEEVEIVRAAFMEHIVDLIEDLNGNHVVQKCLIKLNSDDNQFIYNGITQNLVSVATLRHGCCVLQRCFDFGTIEQQQQLIDQILANATILVEDSFGNYVLQYILDIDFPDLAIQLINQFEGEIFRMSKEKCSSNVIEKCMKSRNPICTQRVMRELLSQSNDPSSLGVPLHKPEVQQSIVQSNLYELLQDPFGNYVLQTCLAEGAIKCPTEYVTMVQLISPFVQKLQQNSNTNKKISQLLNFSNNMPMDQQQQPNRQDKDSRLNYNNNNNLQQQQHGGNKNNNNNNNNYNNNNMSQNYNNMMNPGNNPNYYFIPNMSGIPGNYINFVPNGAYLPNNGNFGQPQFGNFHNNGNNNYGNLGPINPNNYNPKMNPGNKNKMMMMDPNVGSVHLNPLHKINSYDNVDNSRDTVISASPQISLVYPSYASTNQQNNDRMGNGRMNTKNTVQKQNSNSGNNNANNRNNNSNNNNNNNNMGGQQQQQQQQQQHQKKRNNMNANPVHNQKQQV